MSMPCVLNETPNNPHVLEIFHGILPWSLHDAGKMCQRGMIHDIAKTFESNIAFADMPVAVFS